MNGKIHRTIAGMTGLALVFAFGCSGDKSEQSGSPPKAFEAGLCGNCVQKACSIEIDSCLGDADCAPYVPCLLACPAAAPDGDAEPACVEQCVAAAPASAQGLIADINGCRVEGSGSTCVACGGTPGGPQSKLNWILSQTCPPSQDPDACNACEDEHCCETYGAYSKDSAALAYRECYVGCLDESGCAEKCAKDHPGGLDLFAPRAACLFTFCSSAETCGKGQPLPACLACNYANCASEYVGFIGQPDGFLLYNCLVPCATGDDVCRGTCLKKYPNAVESYWAFANCAFDHCHDECK